MNSKVLAQKLGWTLFLLWICYVPEVKLDMDDAYVKSGTLKLSGSRNGSYHLFNGKAVCEKMIWFGCSSGLLRNSALQMVDDGKTPVELVFAPNRGNAIWNEDIVIEVRAFGAVVPGYSKAEMIERMQSFQNRYLASMINLLIFFPIILFPQILKVFVRTD
jgi:hypothetical protein